MAATGVYARLFGAHDNALEAFALGTAAILVAHLAKVQQDLVVAFALILLASRLAHYVFYVTDIDLARSQAFFVGLGAIIALFILSLYPNGASILTGIVEPATRALTPIFAPLTKALGL